MTLLESYNELLDEVKTDCHNPSVGEVSAFYNSTIGGLNTIMGILEELGLESDEVSYLIQDVKDDHSNSIASHLNLEQG